MGEVFVWVVGLVIIVGLPAWLIIAYLLGWVKYDGKGPGPFRPPSDGNWS